MFKVEFFSLRWDTVLLRYYLMMALALAGGFTGQWWIGLLSLPVFLSAITGLGISLKGKENSSNKSTKKGDASVVQMNRKSKDESERFKSA